MTINWSEKQKKAFNWKINQCITAGAGSGKTSVLSERYLKILEDNPSITVFNILALTFTDKAAAEMKNRLNKKLNNIFQQNNSLIPRERIREIKDDLPYAPISTIHSFCSNILRQYPIDLGIDPLFSIIDSFKHNNLVDIALDSSLDNIAENQNHPLFKHLDKLTDFLSREDLKSILKTLVDKRPLTNEIISNIRKCTPDPFLEELIKDNITDANLEKQHIEYINAICSIYDDVIKNFNALKGDGRLLDFADLEEKTINLLQDNEKIAEFIRDKYKFVIVDEFQDTNYIQWNILKPIVTRNNAILPERFFVVGDHQQSIYSFRGADIRTFDSVRKIIKESEKIDSKSHGEEIILSENYRSRKEIIHFVNYVFTNIKSSTNNNKTQETKLICLNLLEEITNKYKVGFHKLESGLKFPDELKNHGSVNFLIVSDKNNKEENRAAEADLIASKIKEIVEINPVEVYDPSHPKADSKTGLRKAEYRDIVILFRATSKSSLYEDSLRKFKIPFISTVSSGFFNCEEVLDIINLIGFLSDQTSDIKLLGLLRGPIFAFSDDLLLAISEMSKISRLSYWEKLKSFRSNITDAKPDIDKDKIKNWITLTEEAFKKINEWVGDFNEISLSDFISKILENTGTFAYYFYGDDGIQKCANINKLKQMIIDFEIENGISFSAFVEEVLLKGQDFQTKESEAQIVYKDLDIVLISTIHKAKGLEFPIVFIADGSHEFNFGSKDKIIYDQDTGFGISIPYINKNNFTKVNSPRKTFISQINKTKTILEEQRMLYVAFTRAKDHIYFCASKPSRQTTYSFFSFLYDIFGDSIYEDKIEYEFEGLKSEINCFNSTNINYEIINTIIYSNEKLNEESAKINPSDIGKYINAIPAEDTDILFPVTSLMTYIDCPRNYFLTKIIGFTQGMNYEDEEKEIFVNDDEIESDNTSDINPDSNLTGRFGLEFGIIAHLLFKLIIEEKYQPNDSVIDSIIKKREIETGLILSHFKNDLKKILKNFTCTDMYSKISNSSILKCEFPFDMRLSKGRISGVIDLMFKNGNDWEIIDYKTNKINKDKTAELSLHYKFQMMTYALFLMKFNPDQEKITATLYFTNPDIFEKFDFFKYKNKEYEDEINSVIENIRSCKFNANTIEKCTYCFFRKKLLCI